MNQNHSKQKMKEDHYQMSPKIDFHHFSSAKNRSTSNDQAHLPNNDSFDIKNQSPAELYSSKFIENRQNKSSQKKTPQQSINMLSKILYDDSFYTTTKQDDLFKNNPYLQRAVSKKVAQDREHRIM